MKTLKRILASVLAVVLCISLLPAVPAAAAGDTTGLDGHAGFVFDYSVEKTTTDKEYIHVVVSIYQLNEWHSMLSLRFRYNTEKLGLTTPAKGTPVNNINVLKDAVVVADLPQFLKDKGVSGVMSGGDDNSPYKALTRQMESISTGKIMLACNAQENISNISDEDYNSIFETNEEYVGEFKWGSNELIKLFDIYLAPTAGHTVAEITGEDLGIYPDPENGITEGWLIADHTNQNIASVKAPVFRSWPKTPEKSGSLTVTVKNGASSSTTISNMNVALTGTSTGGTAVSETGTTGSDGTVVFENVPVGNSYTVTATGSGSGSDGKTYKASASSTAADVNVTEAGGTATIGNGFSEVTTSYTFQVGLKNRQGGYLDLTDATITWGGVPVSKDGAARAAGPISVTVAQSGVQDMVISGLEGYQPVKASMILTPGAGDNTIAKLQAADGNKADVAVSGSGSAVELTVTAPQTVTNVTLPLPVPEVEEGKKASAEELGNMTVTFAPAAGMPGSEDLRQEISGSIVVKPEIKSDGSGEVTDITVAAGLPDGVYDMTIGGAGVNSSTITVTVKDGVVNVGGKPTVDGDKLTGVEGGVTATPGTGNTPDENGNGSVSLLPGGGDTLTDGGNVTIPETPGSTPSVSGGTTMDSDKGLLDSTQPGISDGLTTTVMTDPMYVVRVVEKTTGSTSSPEYEAQIFLKNITASAGTFGMYVNKDLFDWSGNVNDLLTLEDSIVQFSDLSSSLNQLVNPQKDADTAYLTFSWEVKESGDSINANSGEVKIATVQLPLQTSAAANIKDNLTLGSVQVQPYIETANNDVIKGAYTGDNAADYNAAIATWWRTVDNTDTNALHKPLDASKATRGGFYQASGIDVTGDGMSHSYDMRTQIIMPEDVTKLRVDMIVVDGNGTPISGAEIKLYDANTIVDNGMVTGDVELTVEPIASFTTLSNGRAYFAVNENGGKYYYSVTHTGGSYWAYPNGTYNTEEDGFLLDQFQIDPNGGSGKVTTLTELFPDADQKTTEVRNDQIYVVMNAKSYHKASLEVKDNNTLTGTASTKKATLSGAPKLYDGMDYTFTITPGAGYQWASGKTMDDVAAALGLYLYGTDATKTTAENDMYQAGTPDTITAGTPNVTWDATAKVFTLSGSQVNEQPVGSVSFGDGVEIPAWYDAMRGGNLIIVLPDELLAPADYSITVKSDSNMSTTVSEPEPNRTEGNSEWTVNSGTATSTLPAGPHTGPATIVEELSNGRTDSADYTFKPDDGYVIDKVLVNGSELTLTEAQKNDPDGFKYGFQNVTGDESIVVTVAKKNDDPEKPPVSQSDPTVTVTLGDFGKGKFDQNSTSLGESYTANADITGGPHVYSFTKDGAVVVTVTPDSGYQLDTVVITVDEGLDENGDPKPATVLNLSDLTYTADGDGFNTNALTYTFPADKMVAGRAHSVVVTFKEAKENAPSIQAIVESSVAYGWGSVYVNGTTILPVGSTASFTMTPQNSKWLMKNEAGAGAVVVETPDGGSADVSDDVTEASGVYSYTTDALQGGTTKVKVSFAEVEYTIQGKVMVIYNGTGKPIERATLTFQRKLENGKFDDTTEVRYTVSNNPSDPACIYSPVAQVSTGGTGSGKGELSFNITLPAGEWTLTVSKHGYLNYIISEFVVSENAKNTLYFGDGKDGSEDAAGTAADMKAIMLTPGDASWDGRVIAADDIGFVALGWAAQATNPLTRQMADIDELTLNIASPTTNRSSDSTDMGYVTSNLNTGRTRAAYGAFSGS